ncbi:fimbrial protein [Enterobacteriaceae bacterium LUAb1]
MSSRKIPGYLLITLLSWYPGQVVYAENYDELTVTTRIQEGGCTINGPGKVALYSAGIDDFNRSRTAKIATFTLLVSQCKGGGDGKTPVITVERFPDTVPLTGTTDIFAEAVSGHADHAGIAIRAERYNGPLSGFYVPGQMISVSNMQTYSGIKGQPMAEKNYIYTAGLVSDGINTPTIGTVQARFIFNVNYQ